jgi:two-component system, OmpR family, phosphate regulon response regulator PhoB
MTQTQVAAASILLAEDDPAVAAMLKDVLAFDGYDIWSAESGAEVEAILRDAVPDLVILDLMLPDINGLVLFFDIKARADVPIIICSGTRRKEDGVLGLRLGAEDFIAKPFSPQELRARVEAVLRRTHVRPAALAGGQDDCQQIGSLVVDRTRCRVTIGDVDARLTPTEYRLMSHLVTRADEVVTKKDLADAVWGAYDPDIGRTLDVHVRRLRAKLRTGPNDAPLVETVRGFGYRLTRGFDRL